MTLKRLVLALALASASMVVGVVAANPAYAMSPCQSDNPPDWCFTSGGSLHDPTGTFSSASRGPAGLTVIGSATDRDGGPVSVDITVNGVVEGTVVANGTGGTFYATVPVTVEGSSVCATARNIGLGSDVSLGCKDLSVKISPFGALDVASMSPGAMQVTGWAVDPDTSNSIYVNVITNGVTYGPYLANLYRTDSEVYPIANQGYGYNHGYSLSVPAVNNGELNNVCVVALNVGLGSNTTFCTWL